MSLITCEKLLNKLTDNVLQEQNYQIFDLFTTKTKS